MKTNSLNCQKVQEAYVARLTGGSSPMETAEVQSHLVSCSACQAEWAALSEISHQLREPVPVPSDRLRGRFQQMLALHRAEARVARTGGQAARIMAGWRALPPQWQSAAAAIVLLCSVWGGVRWGEARGNRQGESAAQSEISRLSSRLDDMDRLVTASLAQRNSAGARLQEVQAVARDGRTDRRVLTDLAGALAFEPSVNVRYSTVEALAAHASDPVVRAGVRAILPRESSPLVQLAMIELLAEANDTESAPTFDRINRDETVPAEVREAARRALFLVGTPAERDGDRPAKPSKGIRL